jgi:signal transduction histidine kinase
VEIDRWGLTSALEQLTASAKGLSDTDLEFQCDEGIEVVDGIAAMHLYRIAQEALRNALEHGKVSQITITLSTDIEGLKLEIRDNGKGFSMGTLTSRGAGLFSMHHRAELIGATFGIESSVGHGTSVTCSLPHAAEIENAKDRDTG